MLPPSSINPGTTKLASRERKPSRARSTSSTSSIGKTTRDYKSSSPRIVFGPGVLTRLPSELGRLHLMAPLIVCSPSRADLAARVKAYIPNLDLEILNPSIIEHFSGQDIDDEAFASIHRRDCVVSVGGGSAIAMARAIGLRRGIPHICIPTTYSGNELRMAMPSCANPVKERRRGRRESLNKPAVIIYDEELTMSLSKTIPAPIGSRAIAHSSESSQRPKDTNLWSYIHLPGV